jgi:hypothetical protein
MTIIIEYPNRKIKLTPEMSFFLSVDEIDEQGNEKHIGIISGREIVNIIQTRQKSQRI